MSIAPGDGLLHYRIVDKIGEGGMGVVWKAVDTNLDRDVAIKVLPDSFATDGERLARSEREAKLLATLNPFVEKSPHTQLECALVAAEIENGQVVVEPLIYQTREMAIVSGGNIDLVTEHLKLDFHTQVRTGIGLSAGMVVNPFIRLGGTLASPAIEIDPANTAVKGGLAVATVGLSVVGRSLYDRFLSEKEPCQKALDKLLEAEAGGN